MKQFNVGDTAVLIVPINDSDHGYFRSVGDKVVIRKVEDSTIIADVGHVDYALHPDMLVTMDMWKGIYNAVAVDISRNIKRLP